jgi:phenylalanyl-tRNA synthetase beta chain
VETLLSRLDPNRVIQISASSAPGYAAGACGQIMWGGVVVGHLGKIDRVICNKVSLKEPVCAAELELSVLLDGARPVRQLKPLPRFPSVDRDLSLIVAEGVEYASIETAIAALKLPDLESIEYVTTYRGKPLEKGTKSVSLRLIFRSATTTLTSAQVEDSMKKAAEACREKLGAVQRV